MSFLPGFQNILDGLIGPELVEDLKLFKGESFFFLYWYFTRILVFCTILPNASSFLIKMHSSACNGDHKFNILNGRGLFTWLYNKRHSWDNSRYCLWRK